jgi:hypothetical protein
VVRYRREAFQDPHGTLRVTLDEGVQAFAAPRAAFDRGALDAPALGAAMREEPWCVLETKSRGPLPSWLEELLVRHAAPANEYSKMAMASRAVHGAL